MKQIKPIPKNHQRQWRQCVTCGAVAYHDYSPASEEIRSSEPLACGHGLARYISADEALIEISNIENGFPSTPERNRRRSKSQPKVNPFHINVNDRVEYHTTNGFWSSAYPATVKRVGIQRCFVEFDDGGSKWIEHRYLSAIGETR